MNHIKISSLIFLLLTSFALSAHAQNTLKGTELTAYPVPLDQTLHTEYCSVGIYEMPEFPGGIDSLKRFTIKHISYPESAINDKIEGKVFIQFIIDSTGNVVDKKIARSVRSDVDSVCLVMLDHMPKWKPGKIQGKNIAVTFMWPITFRLDTE